MQVVKHLFGTAVVVADVLFGMALPQVIKNLHKKGTPHAHVYGAVGVYVVLGLLTLWVIVSVAQAMSERAEAKKTPPPRPGLGYPFGGGR